jgi:signal transduction histidine kinase
MTMFGDTSLQGMRAGSPISEAHSTPGRTVALICHDLRLPLSSILANAEFLTGPGISDMERAKLFQEICWAVARHSITLMQSTSPLPFVAALQGINGLKQTERRPKPPP